MTQDLTSLAQQVRSTATPARIVAALGLGNQAKRQAAGLLIRCPAHNESTPSCSVTEGPDGTVRAKCFGCDWTADVFGLVAQVCDLSLSRDWPEVVARAAGYLGLDPTVAANQPIHRPEPKQAQERPYPPRGEVLGVWSVAESVERNGTVYEALVGRGLCTETIHNLNLARAIHPKTPLPRWASYRGEAWPAAGYWLILPMVDHLGTMVSLRAWRVEESRDAQLAPELTYEEVRHLQAQYESMPKRLPPGGYRSSGIVMANGPALRMLRREGAPPDRLIIAEGEPDYLTMATSFQDAAVLGIISGSWTEQFASAIPKETTVGITTHNDTAGDKYADSVAATLQKTHKLVRIFNA